MADDGTSDPTQGPTSGGPVPQDAAAPDGDDGTHHRRRVRGSLRVLLSGTLLGVVAGAGLGAAVGDGRAALATLLLVTALASALAGLHHGLLLVLDDVRGRPTSLRRGAWLGGFFVLTAALMAMVAGIGG